MKQSRRLGLHTEGKPKVVFPRQWHLWFAQCVDSSLTDNQQPPRSSPHFKLTGLHTPFFTLPYAVEEASVAFSVKWEGRRKENLQVCG